ncbi:MAG: hypothetical protein ACO28P_01405 [Ilumatobacteraceae bacterium]
MGVLHKYALATYGYVPAPVDSVYTVPADGIPPAPGVPMVWFGNHWCQIAKAYVNTAKTGLPAVWEEVYADTLIMNVEEDGTGKYTITISRSDGQPHAFRLDWDDKTINQGVCGSASAKIEHWYAKAGHYYIAAINDLDGQALCYDVHIPQPTYEHHLEMRRVGTADPQVWHIEVRVPAKANEKSATCLVSINSQTVNAAVPFVDGVAILEHTFGSDQHGDQVVNISYPGIVTPLSGTIQLPAAQNVRLELYSYDDTAGNKVPLAAIGDDPWDIFKGTSVQFGSGYNNPDWAFPDIYNLLLGMDSENVFYRLAVPVDWYSDPYLQHWAENPKNPTAISLNTYWNSGIFSGLTLNPHTYMSNDVSIFGPEHPFSSYDFPEISGNIQGTRGRPPTHDADWAEIQAWPGINQARVIPLNSYYVFYTKVPI